MGRLVDALVQSVTVVAIVVVVDRLLWLDWLYVRKRRNIAPSSSSCGVAGVFGVVGVVVAVVVVVHGEIVLCGDVMTGVWVIFLSRSATSVAMSSLQASVLCRDSVSVSSILIILKKSS
jgi:hypothetical protein